MNRILPLALLLALAPLSAQAGIKTETIKYKAGGTELVGFAAWDDANDDPRPGVLVIHEWWGLNDYAKKRAKMLASLGYVGFAIDMYGGGKNSTDPAEAGKWAGEIRGNAALAEERFTAAYNWLRNREEVDARHIGAIGYCFGGGMVLEMARAGLNLDGVVSFHGNLKSGRKEPAKEIKAAVLVCHGSADAHVTPDEMHGFMQEMDKAGATWEIDIYSGAKHGFTNPDAGKGKSDTVGYDKTADERSWDSMKAFFASVFD